MIIKSNDWFEDNEEIKSFKTYNNYLLSLRQFIDNEYGVTPQKFDKLKIACEQKPTFAKIQTNKKADIEKIKKLLFNSWHTEIVFSIPRKTDNDLVRYSNHWAPIQAYYSIFLLLRAFFESMGMDCPNTHTNTLQQISECILERDLLPSPWSSYCRGLKNLNNLTYGNFTEEYRGISNLSIPCKEDFWSWYALWLKTTRERKFETRKEEVLKNKVFKRTNNKPRKNLAIEHKRVVDRGLHATTFFDGLYRLRIRSNYEDADAFILGTMSQKDAVCFHDSLVVILQSTLFVLEKYTAKYISNQDFYKIVDEFMENLKTDIVKETIGLRKNYF
jgi:hypothetical protein